MKSDNQLWYIGLMSEIEAQPKNAQEFLRPSEPSQDPEYLAWREAKIRKALADDLADPDGAIPQEKIWKKYGLEY